MKTLWFLILVAVFSIATTAAFAAETTTPTLPSTPDFTVTMDRETYQFGESPRMMISGTADLYQVEFTYFQLFQGNLGYVEYESSAYRLGGNPDFPSYVATWRRQHTGDQGKYTVCVSAASLLKCAKYTVVEKRATKLECSPAVSQIKNGQPFNLKATGGDGSYVWIPELFKGADSMDTVASSNGDTLNITYPLPNWRGSVVKAITVESAGQTATCLVRVMR